MNDHSLWSHSPGSKYVPQIRAAWESRRPRTTPPTPSSHHPPGPALLKTKPVFRNRLSIYLAFRVSTLFVRKATMSLERQTHSGETRCGGRVWR